MENNPQSTNLTTTFTVSNIEKVAQKFCVNEMGSNRAKYISFRLETGDSQNNVLRNGKYAFSASDEISAGIKAIIPQSPYPAKLTNGQYVGVVGCSLSSVDPPLNVRLFTMNYSLNSSGNQITPVITLTNEAGVDVKLNINDTTKQCVTDSSGGGI